MMHIPFCHFTPKRYLVEKYFPKFFFFGEEMKEKGRLSIYNTLFNIRVQSFAKRISIYYFMYCSREAPFVDDNPFGLYQKILSGIIHWPSCLNDTVAQ